MNKDNKVLLTALIIIMVGALSFNYTNLTGKVAGSSSYTSITVSPNIIKAGESIFINVNPGRKGIYQEAEIYRADNDMRVGGADPNLCSSSKCYSRLTKEYKILDTWDKNSEWDYITQSKDYYVRVYDINSGKYIRSNYFSVERAYEAAGPAVHR